MPVKDRCRVSPWTERNCFGTNTSGSSSSSSDWCIRCRRGSISSSASSSSRSSWKVDIKIRFDMQGRMSYLREMWNVVNRSLHLVTLATMIDEHKVFFEW